MTETVGRLDLVLVRGLPGSGKTTFAKQLMHGFADLIGSPTSARVFAADDFFMVDDQYIFAPDKLPEAHIWCQTNAAHALNHGQSAAVANTFSERWELEPYFKIASEYCARVFVVDLFDSGLSDEDLAMRTVRTGHRVPLASIKIMRSRWEHDWKIGNPKAPWDRAEAQAKE